MARFVVYKGEDPSTGKEVGSFPEIVVALNWLEGPMSFKKVINLDTEEVYSAFDILTFNESYKDAKNTIRAIETVFG